FFFFFSSRRRHTRSDRDWSSDVCSSDLEAALVRATVEHFRGQQDHARAGAEGGHAIAQPGCNSVEQPARLEELRHRRRLAPGERSEERRVGKECRSRSSAEHREKKWKGS